MKFDLHKAGEQLYLQATYEEVIKDIVIQAATQKEAVLRASIKQLLKEVLQEIEQPNPQESA